MFEISNCKFQKQSIIVCLYIFLSHQLCLVDTYWNPISILKADIQYETVLYTNFIFKKVSFCGKQKR